MEVSVDAPTLEAAEQRMTEQRMRLARIAYDKSISATLPHTRQKGLITLRFNDFGELLSVKRGACNKAAGEIVLIVGKDGHVKAGNGEMMNAVQTSVSECIVKDINSIKAIGKVTNGGPHLPVEMLEMHFKEGHNAITKGEYEKGISQLKEALEYAQTMGTKHHEATILGNIGAGYQRMGNFEEALEYMLEDLKLKKELGDVEGEQAVYFNLSATYNCSGNLDRALYYHNKCNALMGPGKPDMHQRMAEAEKVAVRGGRQEQIEELTTRFGKYAIRECKAPVEEKVQDPSDDEVDEGPSISFEELLAQEKVVQESLTKQQQRNKKKRERRKQKEPPKQG